MACGSHGAGCRLLLSFLQVVIDVPDRDTYEWS